MNASNHPFSLISPLPALCFLRTPAEGDCDEAVQPAGFSPAAAGRRNHRWNEGRGKWLQ